jgi:hypothetical protein
VGQIVLMEAKSFPGESFKAVSQDGDAGIFADGDAESRVGQAIGADVKFKETATGGLFVGQNSLELFVGTEALRFFEKQTFHLIARSFIGIAVIIGDLKKTLKKTAVLKISKTVNHCTVNFHKGFHNHYCHHKDKGKVNEPRCPGGNEIKAKQGFIQIYLGEFFGGFVEVAGFFADGPQFEKFGGQRRTEAFGHGLA